MFKNFHLFATTYKLPPRKRGLRSPKHVTGCQQDSAEKVRLSYVERVCPAAVIADVILKSRDTTTRNLIG